MKEKESGRSKKEGKLIWIGGSSLLAVIIIVLVSYLLGILMLGFLLSFIIFLINIYCCVEPTEEEKEQFGFPRARKKQRGERNSQKRRGKKLIVDLTEKSEKEKKENSNWKDQEK